MSIHGKPDDPDALPSGSDQHEIDSVHWLLIAAVSAIWAGLHTSFADRLIYHDSWLHLFPFLSSVSRHMACAGMPDWLGMVDSGSSTVIYVISSSITNLVRLPSLLLMSCLPLELKGAIHFYQVHVFVIYLLFGFGTYVMGRELFERGLPAVYLFAAILFSGLCLQTVHSDQTVTILFWVPWIVICAHRFHRERTARHAHWYLNAMALLLGLQALDQAPHFVFLTVGVALLLYAVLQPHALVEGLQIHYLRLWPAALILAVIVAQLFIVKTEIIHYTPSLRTDLVVNPAAFDETGFAQPSAFVGSFFPVSFVTGFETLASGLQNWRSARGLLQRGFVYRMDIVVFFFGIIPTILAVAFLLRPRNWRLAVGWGIFTLVMALVALQQSKLYWAIYHIPFFNLFRSYVHFLFFGIFSFLLMGGYGMNVLLDLPSAARRRLALAALAVTGVMVTIAALFFAWFYRLAGAPALLGVPILLDMLMLLAAFVAVGWAACIAVDARKGMAVGILILVISHAAYQALTYNVLGIPIAEGIARIQLDEADRTPLPPADASNPDALTRKLCTRFEQCYLSLRDTASLRRDLEGTFLRSRNEAVFQPGLAASVVEALTAIGQPIFWTSRRAEPYSGAAELIAHLNGNASRIGDYLREVVFFQPRDLDRLGTLPPSTEKAELSNLARGVDWLQLSYRAGQAFYLNAAITYDPHWRVTISGRAVNVVRGYFNGLALAVPSGNGVIRFEYVNWASRFFFASRITMIIGGLATIIWLCVTVLRRRNPLRSAGNALRYES